MKGKLVSTVTLFYVMKKFINTKCANCYVYRSDLIKAADYHKEHYGMKYSEHTLDKYRLMLTSVGFLEPVTEDDKIVPGKFLLKAFIPWKMSVTFLDKMYMQLMKIPQSWSEVPYSLIDKNFEDYCNELDSDWDDYYKKVKRKYRPYSEIQLETI